MKRTIAAISLTVVLAFTFAGCSSTESPKAGGSNASSNDSMMKGEKMMANDGMMMKDEKAMMKDDGKMMKDDKMMKETAK